MHGVDYQRSIGRRWLYRGRQTLKFPLKTAPRQGPAGGGEPSTQSLGDRVGFSGPGLQKSQPPPPPVSRPERMYVLFRQLCDRLQIAPPRLRELLSQGCPHRVWGHRRVFCPVAVAMWLHAKGIPRIREPSVAVATTAAQAAAEFAVSLRTFSRWCRRPGFPGRCGQRGRRNGHFPIQEITRWLSKTTATTITNPKGIT